MSKVNPVESIARVLCNFVDGSMQKLDRLKDNLNIDNLDFPDEVPTSIRKTDFVTGVAKKILTDDGNAARAAFETRAQEMTEEHRSASIALDTGSDSNIAVSDDPGYEIPREDDVTVGVIVTEADSDDALANMLGEPVSIPTELIGEETPARNSEKKHKIFTCPKALNFSKAESTQKIKVPAHIPIILEGEIELDGIKVKQIKDELELKAAKPFKGEKEIRILGKEVGGIVFGINIKCTYKKRWHGLW